MARRKVLTIKIGKNTTQICEVNYRKKKPKVYRTLTVTTPEGLFLDGYITNAEDLGSYLSRKLKNAGLKTDHVVFSVSSNKIMSRDVEIPNVKNEMVMPLIQAQANEYLPIDTTDYIISHTILKKEKKAQSMNVMIFASPKELIQGYYELANNMTVKVESIDVEGNGSYQLLKTEVKGNSTLVLQIGDTSTLATVIDEGVLLLQRNINMGLSYDFKMTENDLQSDSWKKQNNKDEVDIESTPPVSRGEGDRKSDVSVIGQTLSEHQYIVEYKDQKLNLYSDNQNEIKTENLLPKFEQNQYYQQSEMEFQNEDANYLQPQMEFQDEYNQIEENFGTIDQDTYNSTTNIPEELEILYSSVTRIIDFYNNSKKGNLIEKVYLIGNGVNIANIEAMASKVLELPVERLKIFERAENEEYLACIGAAINPVDLIPYELADFEQKKTNIKSYIALIGVLVAACLFVVLVAQLLYWGAVREKVELESQIADKQYIQSEYDEYLKAENDYKYLSLIDSMTFRNNEYTYNVLNQMEDKLPANARIQSILSEGSMLTINCKTGSKPSFKETAEMLLQLKQIPYFENVYIDGVVENTEDRTASFSVICTYAYEPNIPETQEDEEIDTEIGAEGGAVDE